ncbi:hypothetical protein M407DRAFT_113871 [Tulasnella calospora MUT 4182]|uniref:Uncharacterized protein n=1 Tax=Tulasnella calospora MUT 4182 TaxID=1051891 RepID=A0A0C3QDT9_9AGAM|nr:hypothetical protein M407DRAFT_113871 [Tulasnella calospora MUT 4182]
MEGVLDTLTQAARTAFNLVHFVAYKLGYDIDTSTLASSILSLIAIYFTIITIYRTATYAIRTVFWLAKWALILYVVGGAVGWFLSGGKGFTFKPVLELAFAYALNLLGWGGLPDVQVQPGGGVRVNGVTLELPPDYHQYGDAWKRFKTKSQKRSKASSRSVFDRFDDSKGSKKKGRSSGNVSGAAAVAQGILGDDGAAIVQSVEAIQKGVSDSFEAVKKAWLGGAENDVRGERAGWWPWSSNEEPSSRRKKSNSSSR